MTQRWLTPYEIRTQSFSTVRRRGLDRDQVDRYLDRVADEVARLHRDLRTVTTENIRIKDHLRRWQTRQSVDSRQIETRAYPTLPPARPGPVHPPGV
jgi:DivIVA domain-containing protein